MRSSAFFASVVLALLALLPAPSEATAQVEISARSATIRVGGRLHFQMAHSSAPDREIPDFFVRRARIVFDVSITDFLDGRLQPAFVTGKVLLQDAYFRMKFDPAFRLSFGQFKQAFDLFELTSSTEINVVERGGFVPGIDVCSGVGRLCSYGRFSARLQYGGRDTGIRADGSFGGGKWSYIATVTNGEGIFENADDNGRKTTAGRLAFTPIEGLTFGANVNAHDYAFESGDEEKTQTAVAWGGDVQWGDFREGWLVQWALMGGQNWRILNDAEEAASFLTTQAIVSYYHPLREGGRLEGIEPAFRLSWGDPDTDADDDAGWLVTPGFNIYVLGRNRINFNADVWVPQQGDTEFSLRAMTYLYF